MRPRLQGSGPESTGITGQPRSAPPVRVPDAADNALAVPAYGALRRLRHDRRAPLLSPGIDPQNRLSLHLSTLKFLLNPIAVVRVHPGRTHDDMAPIDLPVNRIPKRPSRRRVVNRMVLGHREIAKRQRGLPRAPSLTEDPRMQRLVVPRVRPGMADENVNLMRTHARQFAPFVQVQTLAASRVRCSTANTIGVMDSVRVNGRYTLGFSPSPKAFHSAAKALAGRRRSSA